MTSIAESVKQQIVTLIKGLPRTGNVYDRVKYTSNWQNFKDQFAFVDPSNGMQQIRGWWITIPTLLEGESDGNTFDTHWHNYQYPIHAVMSYSDKGDTEPAFEEMVYSVYQKLHFQGVLGLGPDNPVNGSVVIDGSIGVTIITIDMRMFGSMLCHHAEMRVTVGVAEPVVWDT